MPVVIVSGGLGRVTRRSANSAGSSLREIVSGKQDRLGVLGRENHVDAEVLDHGEQRRLLEDVPEQIREELVVLGQAEQTDQAAHAHLHRLDALL